MLLDLLNNYRVEAQHMASALLALAIWRRGAAPERWLIGLFIGTMVVPLYLFRGLGLGNPAFGPNAWLYLSLDIIATIGFVLVALNANRNYPLWIAGFQLVAIGAHAVRGLIDTVSPVAFVILVSGPSYCQLVLIFGGFLRHRARERRFGSYRDWRTPSDQTPLFNV